MIYFTYDLLLEIISDTQFSYRTLVMNFTWLGCPANEPIRATVLSLGGVLTWVT